MLSVLLITKVLVLENKKNEAKTPPIPCEYFSRKRFSAARKVSFAVGWKRKIRSATCSDLGSHVDSVRWLQAWIRCLQSLRLLWHGSMYKTERPDFAMNANQLRMLMKDIKVNNDTVGQSGMICKQVKQAQPSPPEPMICK